jgi:GlpG protein
MRQLVTLPSADVAQKLADHLLTLRIDTKLEKQPDGWAIWVRDEDHVAKARQELEEFTHNPNDPRYAAASSEASAIRRQKASADSAYHRRQERFYRRMGAVGNAGGFTVALIVVSAVIHVISSGGDSKSAVIQDLSISPYRFEAVWMDPTRIPRDGDDESIRWVLLSPGLEPILHGQVWRLVTPIFIHKNILHLVFNMWCLYVLGGVIERRRGRIRFLALVLVTAILSNLAQYFLGHATWEGYVLHPHPQPNFGGMSGVVYGLLGYVWMKARFQPELGLSISPNSIIIMIGWFFLCMTGWVGSIANWAHAAGLIVGMLIGYVPTLWRSFSAE